VAHILIVDDSPPQVRQLDMLLTEAGHTCEAAGDGAAGLAAVRRRRPDVVLTDMQMPGMSGLELVAALREQFPGLPVVLCAGSGSEELAVEALRAGAAHYVPKRRLTADAVPVLDEILSVAAAQRNQHRVLDCTTAVELTYTLGNDPDFAALMVSQAEQLMKQLGLFDPGVHVRIGVAIQEAVVNAVVHGNLEVSSALKAGDWDAYHAAIARRAEVEPYRHRRVTVTLRAVRGTSLTVTVTDQGPGFDPTKLPDPTDPANIERGSGRGLLLIRTFFDTVTHSPRGNTITMHKGA
jgi:CheY-like chemotaxis protein/anti-sigma regulatory factor (Ser/Thr protein kinase)